MEIHCWVTMTPTPKAIATSSRVWPLFGPCAHATPGNHGSELIQEPSEIDVGFNMNRFFRRKVILHLTPCVFLLRRAYDFSSLWQKKQWTFIMTFGNINKLRGFLRALRSDWTLIWQVTIFHSICSFAPPLWRDVQRGSNLIRDWFAWSKLYVCLPVSTHTFRLVQSNQSSSVCNAKSH